MNFEMYLKLYFDLRLEWFPLEEIITNIIPRAGDFALALIF